MGHGGPRVEEMSPVLLLSTSLPFPYGSQEVWVPVLIQLLPYSVNLGKSFPSWASVSLYVK